MLETLGNLGDFIGGIAVVVTLLYLAVQIRQNTQSVRASSWQAVVSGARETNRLRSEPETYAAWLRGMTAYPTPSLEDNALFSRVIVDEALQFQGAFALFRSGQLDAVIYLPYLDWFAAIVSAPGGASWWDTVGRAILYAEMVEAVDARVKRGGLFDILSSPGNLLEAKRER